MSEEKAITSPDRTALEGGSCRDVSPSRRESERREARTPGNEGEHSDRKSPKITVKQRRGAPLKIDMEPIDAMRLMSAFGTAEPGFANLMLSGIINAACDRGPPEAETINHALAAVTGIGARDETEAMLATQMVATHVAAIGILRQLKGSENVTQQDSNGNLAIKLLRTFTMQLDAYNAIAVKVSSKSRSSTRP